MHIVRRLALVALLVGLLVLGWSFAARNADPRLQVDFWVVQTPEAPVWTVLVAAFVLGALLAAAVCLFEVVRYALMARRYRRTVARLEAEIHQLRNLPLADEGSPRRAAGVGPGGAAAPPGGPLTRRG